MNRRVGKLIGFLAVMWLFLMMGNVIVQAEEGEEGNGVPNKVPYAVKPVFPENQIDSKLSYYYLKMQPGQTQTVEIQVTNTSDQPIKVDAQANSAMTSIHGAIDYLPESKENKFDKTLKVPFSTIASVDKNISIPAKETVNVPVTIAMPPEEFNGVVLGGVEFIQTDEDQAQEESSGGMAIRNRFRYIVVFKLTESDVAVKPELKLNQVKAAQVSYRNVVSANLQNIEPAIANDVRIEAKVTRKGSTTVLYEQDKKDMQIAPNTNFNFPIPLGKKPFEAGKYTLYLIVTARDDQKWEFKKDFDITRDEANKYNKDSVIELDGSINWWLYIGIGAAVLLVIGGVVFFLWKKKAAGKKGKTSKRPSTTKREVNDRSNRGSTSKGSDSKDRKRKKNSSTARKGKGKSSR